jgi:hypothetical protein
MNSREPSPAAQFSALLSRFPREIVALVKRCLPKIRRAAPCPFELVYDYRDSIVVSFSPSDRGYEGIVGIAIFPHEVRLYLDKSLPDPKGLLKGSGSKLRSIDIKAASDLDHEDIQALFKAAIERVGAKFAPSHSPSMIIKSGSKTQGSKKPGSKKQGSKKTGRT